MALKKYEIVEKFGPYTKGSFAVFNEEDAKKHAKFIKEVTDKKAAATDKK
ncbi:hypothetical protein Dip510_001588 [Elusimicrobium posterum]